MYQEFYEDKRVKIIFEDTLSGSLSKIVKKYEFSNRTITINFERNR